jgi:type II secretion system protein C
MQTSHDQHRAQSSLALRHFQLQDVIVDGEGRPRALIHDEHGDLRTYGVGDTVFGAAVVERIENGQVILRATGGAGSRWLLRPASEPVPLSASSDPLSAGTASDLASPHTVAGGLIDAAPGQQPGEDRQQQVLQYPWEMLQYEMAYENNQLIGWKIGPKEDRAFLAAHGLAPGDIITHVNGYALDAGQNQALALEAMRTANNLALTVRRGGQVLATQVPNRVPRP